MNMRTVCRLILASVGLAAGSSSQDGSAQDAGARCALRGHAEGSDDPYGELFASGFVANEGQWDTPARFVLIRRELVVEVLPRGLLCRTKRASPESRLALTFVGARDAATDGAKPLPGARHFYLGDDPGRWRAHVPAFAEVTWRDLYPGIDVRLVTTAEGVRYDLLLAPGADLSAVRVQWSGQTGLRLEPDGSLNLATEQGPVRQSPPVAWYELGGGERHSVECRLRPVDGETFGFELTDERLEFPLVVDPGLDFYVFLGGSYFEKLNAIVEAPDGTLIVGGQTQGPDFPTTAGAVQPRPGGFGEDGFIARMDARARTLLYATYLGGNHIDEITALVFSDAGEVFATGETFSTDFPVTPGAFMTRSPAPSKAFVARLSRDGSALIYSTYLAGNSNNRGTSIALGPGDEAFVTGWTQALDFPVTPGAFRTIGSAREAFVTRLNSTGSGLVASTFFGGSRPRVGYAFAFDEGSFVNLHPTGDVALAGSTVSLDLPVTANAFQPSIRGAPSAFFALLDPGLSTLVYGTYYGGSAGEAHFHFAQNPAGHLVITGRTGSRDLPGAVGRLEGAVDLFAAVLDPFRLVAARYVNTPDNSGPYDVHLDCSGVVTLSAGMAAGFATTPGAWQRVPRTTLGAGFISRFGPDLDLWYASYFGGTVGDGPDTIARTRDGWTLLGGRGASPDMPTPGVFNTTRRGINDAFVARMDLLPTGVERYGTSSPACNGPIVMDTNRMPANGTPDFTIACSAAPPLANGWLLLGAEPDDGSTRVLGASLHVSAARFLGAIPATSDALGFGAVRLPLLKRWAGTQLFAQFLWVNPANCTGTGALSSSNALRIVVQ